MFYKSIVDNIQAKQFEKELEKTNDIYKYLNKEYWSRLCEKSKKILINKIHEIECQRMDISITIDLKYFESKDRTIGMSMYENKLICINEKRLTYNDGFPIYETLIHELTHIKQRIELENKNSNIIDFIYFKNNELLIEFCDFKNIIGNFHIDAIAEIQDKSDIFYHLIKPEREAYQNAHNLGKQLNSESEDKLHEYYTNFNKIYNNNLNKEEINEIIDSCFIHIYNKTYPEEKDKDLKANVMYDLCVIALLLKTKDIEYVNYLISEIKQESLNQYGYEMIFKNTSSNSQLLNNLDQLYKETKEIERE